MSVARMAALAAAATTDDPAVRALAGMVGPNGERALHRWADRQTWRRFLPPPYSFAARKNFQGGDMNGLPYDGMHWAFLPHEVFATLAATPELFAHLLGGPDVLSAFWDGARRLGADWVAAHPVLAAAQASRVVPMGIHGDDAGAHGNEKITVITFGSVAVRHATLDSRILFTMLRDAEAAGRARAYSCF